MKKLESISAPLRLALIMAIICGILFPVVVTGIGQTVFPYQANGELAQVNNTTIGSYLIGQSANGSSYLFNIRNNSASGVDPDITVASALSQANTIHNSTNISLAFLDGMIHNNTKYSLFFFGTAYVNALNLNIMLIEHFHGTVRFYGNIYNNLGKRKG